VNGKPIVFPLVGKALLTGSWGDPRPQGRHAGEDIMAPRRAPVLAAEPGRVKYWTTSALAGCMLYLYAESGTTYLYIHLNNDAGSDNDNRAGCKQGATFTVANGARVQAGEQIAWNGDSGDAAVRGLPERFPAGREAMSLTIFTTPAAATGPMVRGDPGALVAARISKRL